jgi:SAM-dependent methyltransferase
MNRNIWTSAEAEAWDLSVPKSQTRREVGFLTWSFSKFSDRRVKKVLDLACGTGRLALALAEKGYDVTGIDRFATTLARARENAERRSLQLELVQTPLQEINVEGPFDAVYCVQALYYLSNEDELSTALTKIHSLIRPGGILVIDTGNFMSIFGIFKRVRKMQSQGRNWWVKRTVTHRIDDVNNLCYHTEHNVMKVNGRVRNWRETHVLRMWTFPELKLQLTNHGFTNIHLFGQQKAGAKEATDHAPRLVLVTNQSRS